MNILIAIVSESYDDAMNRSEKLFWYQRMDVIAQSGLLFIPGPCKEGGSFPNWLVRDSQKLRKDVNTLLRRRDSSAPSRKGRIAEITSQVTAATEHRMQRIQSDLYKNFTRLDHRVDELFRALEITTQSTAYGSTQDFKEDTPRPIAGLNQDHLRDSSAGLHV